MHFSKIIFSFSLQMTINIFKTIPTESAALPVGSCFDGAIRTVSIRFGIGSESLISKGESDQSVCS